MEFKKKVSVPNMSIKLNNILPLLDFLKPRISCVLSAVLLMGFEFIMLY